MPIASNSENSSLGTPQAPAEIIITTSAPAVPVTSVDKDTEELIKEDAIYLNYILHNLMGAWNSVGNVDEVCKLALTTTKILRDRRELLNKPLGLQRPERSFQGNQSARQFMNMYDT